MTGAQRIALAHPCFLACETAHPRFLHDHGYFSVMVTVNSGYA